MRGRFLGHLAALGACLAALMAANVTLLTTFADAQAASGAPSPVVVNPGDLADFRDRQGQTIVVEVVGATGGQVWGDGTYTDDSDIGTAAVHAGLLKEGQTGILTLKLLPGLQSYPGVSRNGVNSNSWASFDGSFAFVGTAQSPDSAVMADPGNLKPFRDQVGKTLRFQVTGHTDGSVWGDRLYTDDSDLATAAVHAGVLNDGATGVVAVKVLPGQGSYAGASRNGIDSGSYGAWDGSFQFVGGQDGGG